MAGVQDILQASHALLDRLVKARTATGATKVKAGQVQLQATRPGFAAVAAGMARVQEGLTRLVAAQGGSVGRGEGRDRAGRLDGEYEAVRDRGKPVPAELEE